MRLGIVSALLVLLGALGSGSVTCADDEQPDFVWLTSHPFTLDPGEGTGPVERTFADCLYEGLTRLDAESLRPVAAAASAWTVSRDGRRYTFKLRPEARWSNGDRLLAEHFIDAWKRAFDPAFASEWAFLLDPIRHAQVLRLHPQALEALPADAASTARGRKLTTELEAARAHVGVDQGFWAPDPRTIVIELDVFAPYLPRLLAHPAFFPVHASTLRAPPPAPRAPDAPPPPPWERFTSVIGNGPFVMQAYDAKALRMAKSPTYWGREQIAFDRIEARLGGTAVEQLARYDGGEGHWLPYAPLGAIKHPHAYDQDAFITYFLRVNTRREGLEDVRVRRALSLAIDRTRLVKEIRQDRATPAASLVPPGVSGYVSPKTAPSYDPTRARALMKEAGHTDADGDGRLDGFPELELLYNTSAQHRAIAAFIAEQLETKLGIQVRTTANEWVLYTGRVRSGEYGLARSGWIGDYLDPASFLQMLRTDSEVNNTGWSNARFDALLRMAEDPRGLAEASARWPALYEQATDGTRLRDALKAVRGSGTPRGEMRALQHLRMELLREAEAVLIEELPVLPIYYYKSFGIVRPSVGGFHPNVLDYHAVRNMSRR